MWRTLVRVVQNFYSVEYVMVLVPAWDAYTLVKINHSDIPEEILPLMVPGRRLHARVNTGAESRLDLRFDSWEQE